MREKGCVRGVPGVLLVAVIYCKNTIPTGYPSLLTIFSVKWAGGLLLIPITPPDFRLVLIGFLFNSAP